MNRYIEEIPTEDLLYVMVTLDHTANPRLDSPTLKDRGYHINREGKTFEIKGFQGGGWVLTKTNQLFHHDFIALTESDEPLLNQDEEAIVFPTVNETVGKTIEESLEYADSTTTTLEIVESGHQPSHRTVTQELTDDEQRDLLFLERKVERAFYEAGKALQEIRDKRLYRSTHKTFEEYCRERFAHSRQKANFLIAGAMVYDNLTTNCSQNSATQDLTTNCSQILPTNEAQCRPLTKLEPDQQREVWQQAVAAAGGKVPSSPSFPILYSVSVKKPESLIPTALGMFVPLSPRITLIYGV